MNEPLNDPLVTIAIPTYNQKNCIAEAIESALEQTYSNLEIIIADDFSSESIYEIVKEYELDKRIRYYKNEKNLGRTKNYRKCLYEYATGEWYLNLDGDDILTDKNFIAEAMKFVSANKNIVLATAACLRVVNGQVDYKITSQYPEDICTVKGKDFFLDIPSQKAWLSHLTTLYNREKALSLNFYEDDILSSDYASLFKLILTGDVLVFKKVACIWRIHDKNESSQIFAKPQIIIDNFKYVESAAKFAKPFIEEKELKKWKTKILKDQILAVALRFILNKPGKYLQFATLLFLKYPVIVLQTQFKIIKRVFNKILKQIRP